MCPIPKNPLIYLSTNQEVNSGIGAWCGGLSSSSSSTSPTFLSTTTTFNSRNMAICHHFFSSYGHDPWLMACLFCIFPFIWSLVKATRSSSSVAQIHRSVLTPQRVLSLTNLKKNWFQVQSMKDPVRERNNSFEWTPWISFMRPSQPI